MKKIPTLYVRDEATNLRYVRDEVHPDCQWVVDGEGTPTYKWNGTAVLIDDHYQPWKRREVKKGKLEPLGFREETHDEVTGKRTGWVPIDQTDPSNRWHLEALDLLLTPAGSVELAPGTYELVGPKIQGNPHGLPSHELIRHGERPIPAPAWHTAVGFEYLGPFLHGMASRDPGFEGIVWHHPDGRMAKIKAKDFPMDPEPYA